jgi:hypothetical protein
LEKTVVTSTLMSVFGDLHRTQMNGVGLDAVQASFGASLVVEISDLFNLEVRP